MTTVLLGIGSNRDREHHICEGLDALEAAFGPLRVSRVFESEAVGCRADNYFNLVVSLSTDLSLAELSSWIKRLEDRFGRDRQVRRCDQSLDIDILTFGTLSGCFAGINLPRNDITRNAFVLWPLSELVPDEKHPSTGKSFKQLWRMYQSEQKLWPIDFVWRGQRISWPDEPAALQGAAD
ncbi:2-amino-4-hydroxy-6-hydroxymethyldihydropteridine diphosphokinase [Marinobacterium litorale]|uniref:2-amino-4-hydroxy-6- hydroxymethyldihydropteridine diphosphokinase n=1 Tax=Marinobacterium litorale TaxID=404770 RepID=UPI00041F85F6|nr:2-amino-4-hydroxy-6-hydroxymethyldihydropteridine diphosphokinase [Marinobacterium litorale]